MATKRRTDPGPHGTGEGSGSHVPRARARRPAAHVQPASLGARTAPEAGPEVLVVMSSESDRDHVAPVGQVLDEFGVRWAWRILSAHQTPQAAADLARGALEAGVKVVVAAAGGAAHLPGVLAAWTPLPVIGLPVPSGTLGGLDSLLSIAQMPPGVPVAAVAIGGARNAGLLAVEILALGDRSLRERLLEFRARQAERVLEADARLRQGEGSRG
jgi:5-(carboxyamino)imidazole ribonucleotide mutase